MAATDPQLLASQREGDSLRIRARVPRDLPYFDGHFPGHPLLPGFVQLDWVLQLAREQGLVSEPVAAVEALKFRAQLTPELEFELHLEKTSSGLRFAYRSAEGELSSGRLRFDPGLTQHSPATMPPAESAAGLPLRIPQTGRMRVLGGVTEHGAGVTLCDARISDATPLCSQGRAPAWLALELMAQAMAAQGALAAGSAAPPRRGFLVGARRIELRTLGFASGELLWVRARHLRGDTGFIVCECSLGTGAPPRSDEQAHESALALGALKAWVEPSAVESATR